MCTNVYSITKNLAHTAQWLRQRVSCCRRVFACMCIKQEGTRNLMDYDAYRTSTHPQTHTHTHMLSSQHIPSINIPTSIRFTVIWMCILRGKLISLNVCVCVFVLVYKYHRQTSNWTMYTKSIFNSIVWIGFFCLPFVFLVFLLSTYKRRRLSRRYLPKPPLGFGHQYQHYVWCDDTCNRNFSVLPLVYA